MNGEIQMDGGDEMPGVTREQIERAKQVDILDYFHRTAGVL